MRQNDNLVINVFLGVLTRLLNFMRATLDRFSTRWQFLTLCPDLDDPNSLGTTKNEGTDKEREKKKSQLDFFFYASSNIGWSWVTKVVVLYLLFCFIVPCSFSDACIWILTPESYASSTKFWHMYQRRNRVLQYTGTIKQKKLWNNNFRVILSCLCLQQSYATLRQYYHNPT